GNTGIPCSICHEGPLPVSARGAAADLAASAPPTSRNRISSPSSCILNHRRFCTASRRLLSPTPAEPPLHVPSTRSTMNTIPAMAPALQPTTAAPSPFVVPGPLGVIEVKRPTVGLYLLLFGSQN
ncbi:hypothetical protein BC830DRAFT_1113863, partial [Chytriomyces sp. MP71]